MTEARVALRIAVPDSGEVSALFDAAPDPSALLVFAHGAGAGMEHRFMEDVTRRLVTRGVSVLRFRFPYMEAGTRRTDRPEVATAAVAAAVEEASRLAARADGSPNAGAQSGGDVRSGPPVFAGGKSFGGRMTSTAASRGMLDGARGLVFFGFPLHASGRLSRSRGDHLADVRHPQLFLQGTRDKLADLDLLRRVLADVGERATLHVVDRADHGFHVLKRSGRTDEEVLDELADVTVEWITRTSETG